MKSLEKIIKNVLGASLLVGAFAFTGCDSDSDSGKHNNNNTNVTYIRPKCFDNPANWIDYSPTKYNPNTGTYPTEDDIKADLTVLKDAYFQGIITYGSKNVLGKIPKNAKDIGLKVIMGIWDINDQEEYNNALAAKDFVDGYCVGNEGIKDGRYTLDKLKGLMDKLRSATKKPVATAERIDDYNETLFKTGDWVFPNAHPYWHNVKEANAAAAWTIDKYKEYSKKLADLGINRQLVFKEIGLPSAGDTGLSEANQNTYFRVIEDLRREDSALSLDTIVVYFEAFDQPWKPAGVERAWGYLKQDRTKKEASKPQILPVYVPPIGSFDNLEARFVNIIPQNYMLATYINVSGKWWVKPYAGTLTAIPGDSRVTVDITTGGIDETATQINLSIVTPDYVPALNTPPSAADPKVIKQITIPR